MNLADRIQHLRKSKGISQEELAAQIGVSRQAVSKWESEQSMPDLEKLILLSDYFETSTDFLLKGIAPAREPEKKWNAMLFAVAGTILNAIGLVSSIVIWLEWQTIYAVGLGFVILLLGSGIFLAGQCLDANDKPRALRLFLLTDVWILLFIPLSCCFNLFMGLLGGFIGLLAPVPLLAHSIGSFALYWIIYIAICLIVDFFMLRRIPGENKK